MPFLLLLLLLFLLLLPLLLLLLTNVVPAPVCCSYSCCCCSTCCTSCCCSSCSCSWILALSTLTVPLCRKYERIPTPAPAFSSSPAPACTSSPALSSTSSPALARTPASSPAVCAVHLVCSSLCLPPTSPSSYLPPLASFLQLLPSSSFYPPSPSLFLFPLPFSTSSFLLHYCLFARLVCLFWFRALCVSSVQKAEISLGQMLCLLNAPKDWQDNRHRQAKRKVERDGGARERE